ncbi:MAG: hypothetical protein FWE91_06120 [Defluviitaleaceae bacterium]|nr:hypothetical protein [Defluviitaleaceae bacterium]
MTRKQALYKAMEVITDANTNAKIQEILDDMPFTKWSERTIMDTLDQFVLDNGRNPTATDFKVKGMPPHPVIKLRFGINLKEFLSKYYPTIRHSKSQFYYTKTNDEWKDFFIAEYHNIKPTSSAGYDKNRPHSTPCWYTIATMYGVKGWYTWLNFCDLSPYINRREPPQGKTKKVAFNVSSTLTITSEDGVFVYKKNSDIS